MDYLEQGRGPTTIFLHGTVPPESLYGVAERLADQFHTVVPSLPGYGDSPQVEPRTPDAVIDALAQLVDELVDGERGDGKGERKVSLVGHSGGAYFALGLALEIPDKIDRLALLAPAHHITEELKVELPGFAAAARAGQLPYDDMIPMLFSEQWATAHPEAAWAMADAYARDLDAFADDLDSMVHARDLRPEFGHIDHPVYVRSGTLDVRTTPEMVAQIESLLPEATLDFVDGAGHMIHTEDAEGTDAALREFFAPTDR